MTSRGAYGQYGSSVQSVGSTMPTIDCVQRSKLALGSDTSSACPFGRSVQRMTDAFVHVGERCSVCVHIRPESIHTKQII